MMILIPLCGMRRDRVGSKLARHILNGVLIVGEVELSGHGDALNGTSVDATAVSGDTPSVVLTKSLTPLCALPCG
jgi:hypothetical protein